MLLNQAVIGCNGTYFPGQFTFWVVNICEAVSNATMKGALKMQNVVIIPKNTRLLTRSAHKHVALTVEIYLSLHLGIYAV